MLERCSRRLTATLVLLLMASGGLTACETSEAQTSTASGGTGGRGGATGPGGGGQGGDGGGTTTGPGGGGQGGETTATGGMGGMTTGTGGMGSTTTGTGGMGSTTTGTGGNGAFCGDGVLQAPEQCDFGADNGSGAGCDADCTFSCIQSPDSCLDAEACNGVEACVTVTTPKGTGQKCMAGIQALDCTACAGGVCASGVCKASTCGDGCVDPAAGEQCEPPNTPICDALCKTIAVVPCGNGVRDAGEQCDDGNTVNLDGCDASCRFEQDLRSSSLQIQLGPDPFCGNANRLGEAFSVLAGSVVQSSIDQGIKSGSGGFVVKMLDLASPTGADDPSLLVGFMRGAPVAGAGYDGANDLDWWYSVDPASIDAARDPVDKLSGNILGAVLHAGPGWARFPITLLGAGVTLLRLSAVTLDAPIGASFAPTMSAGGSSPGHLPAEHLDPALTSFASAGQPGINFSGKLCGNASAVSFAETPIEAELLPGNVYACLEGYQAANSLLDVLVGGCTIDQGGGPLPVVLPTQPDTADPSVPPGTSGVPYSLGVNAQKKVISCADKDGTPLPLGQCLDIAAYSTFFRFAASRVILK